MMISMQRLSNIFDIIAGTDCNEVDESSQCICISTPADVSTNPLIATIDAFNTSYIILKPRRPMLDLELVSIMGILNSKRFIQTFTQDNQFNISIKQLHKICIKPWYKYQSKLDISKLNWIHSDTTVVQMFIDYIFHNRSRLCVADEKILLSMISSANKSGAIGESIFKLYLEHVGMKYVSQASVGNLRPDFYIPDLHAYYEIKFGLYNMTGTAYEKILNTPHKYRSIPKSKLYIILIGKQEIECQGVFDKDERNLDYIRLFDSHETEFVRFSDLLLMTYRRDLAPKPFIKWVGGKSRIMSHIMQAIRSKMCQLEPHQHISMPGLTYCEPFVGGGSVLFSILSSELVFEEYVVNDLNVDLINVYRCVKDNVEELISELEVLSKMNDAEHYAELRAEYNILVSASDTSSVRKSALFLYLNKTCFRGLYRVNSKSKFNVPYGNYQNINFDIDLIRRAYRVFNTVNIRFCSMSYTELMSSLDISRCLFYLDPPYFDTFADYTAAGFDSDEFYHIISQHHAHIIFSNSSAFGQHHDLSMFQIKEIDVNEAMSIKTTMRRAEIVGW